MRIERKEKKQTEIERNTCLLNTYICCCCYLINDKKKINNSLLVNSLTSFFVVVVSLLCDFYFINQKVFFYLQKHKIFNIINSKFLII